MNKSTVRLSTTIVKKGDDEYLVKRHDGSEAMATYDAILHSIRPSILYATDNKLPQTLIITVEYEL